MRSHHPVAKSILLASVSFLGFSSLLTPVYAQEVLAGLDLFETPAGLSTFELTPIPPDFFQPGSEPFSGRVCLDGIPLDPATKGMTDTVVRRFDAMLLDGPPETIPIEIVALSLQSCAPITVTYPDQPSELWDVRVTLSDLAPQPVGGMTVTKTHPNGGTFDSFLPVQPKLIFTRVINPLERLFDCGTPTSACLYQFQSNGVPWTYEPCPPDMLRVPGLTSNFCPSATGSGRVQTTSTSLSSTHTYLPTATFCGDGAVQLPEECDDGNNTPGDGCDAECHIEETGICGDGVLDPGEQCDDGNNTPGDGCDAFCKVEPTVPTCHGLPATIIGTAGNDTLIGTPGDDVIVGLEGNDKLVGKQGNDILCGNEGDDKLKGNRGNDQLFGDAGDDDLEGGLGNDQLFGSSGDDDLKGEEGEDVACGGADDDRVKGGAGADRMDGGADTDKMKGGAGSDICVNGESVASCEDTTTAVPECAGE